MERLLNSIVALLYRRLGRRYVLVAALLELATALGIAAITIPLLLFYFRPTATQFLVIYAAVLAATACGLVYALVRGRRHLGSVMAWLEGGPDADVDRAWDAATNYAMRSFRANSVVTWVMAAVPTAALVTFELKLQWWAALVIFAATVIPILYVTAVNYALAELMLRPAITDIAAALPEDFPFTANGLPLRKRMKLLVPIFTCFAGFFVASLLSHHRGITGVGESVAASTVIGLVFSVELTVLLGRSVTGPVADLRQGLARIRAGEMDARVPVMTSDELGELSHDFNVMAKGLAEREELREAFMTYLDPIAVPLILSGQYPQSGVELDLTIMFMDVRGFTRFAEQCSATEVVTALNELFEQVVPVILRHGGHVDKFLGDGVLAVFGAPEGYVDHADRALACGVELVELINEGPSELKIGVGINTGPVVIGSIGGAGRLNFSVIGDAVNVASRVEAATRETGDGLLLTEATRSALIQPVELVHRHRVALKGKAEPMAVYTWPGLSGIPVSARTRIGRAIRR